MPAECPAPRSRPVTLSRVGQTQAPLRAHACDFPAFPPPPRDHLRAHSHAQSRVCDTRGPHPVARGFRHWARMDGALQEWEWVRAGGTCPSHSNGIPAAVPVAGEDTLVSLHPCRAVTPCPSGSGSHQPWAGSALLQVSIVALPASDRAGGKPQGHPPLCRSLHHRAWDRSWPHPAQGLGESGEEKAQRGWVHGEETKEGRGPQRSAHQSPSSCTGVPDPQRAGSISPQHCEAVGGPSPGTLQHGRAAQAAVGWLA